MPRWLLILMLVLLPLRAWVGDAMAGQMLQQQLASQGAAAAAATPAAHEDCHGHDAPASADGPSAATELPEDCATCASCQACSAVALALPLGTQAPTVLPQAPPRTVQHVHRSAEREPALKPPIS